MLVGANGRDPSASTHQRRFGVVAWVFAVLFALADLFAPAASADAGVGPEIRVRAFDHPTPAFVGAEQPGSSTSVGVSGPDLRQLVSATGVATNSGVGVADELVGAACSFSGSTLVLMADGSRKQIEDVEVGDMVLATNPETGETVAREVTQLWIHEDTLVDLVVDGDVITTTEDHPFWNESDQEWQRADQLDEGDLVRSADGQLLRVEGLDESSAKPAPAYNVTVDDIHTYYVSAGDDSVLVHNTCNIPGRNFTGPDAPDRAFAHLKDASGLDPNVASNRLHILKEGGGLGAADDAVIGRTGDVYDAATGERLGSLTDP